MLYFRPALLVMFPLLLTRIAVSQAPTIRVSPSFLFLHEGSRSVVVTLTSLAPQAMDVSLLLVFGLPDSYENGSVATRFDENDTANPKSCAPWLRLEAAALTLKPGQPRTVRIDAAPPAGLKDGEYWSNLVLLSGESSGSAQTTALETSSRLAIVPIAYRKGDTYADVKLAGTNITRHEGIVKFSVDLQALGNSAYHGNLKLSIRSAKGKEVLSTKTMLSVFGLSKFSFDIPGKNMPPGTYKASLLFDADRPDLGDAALLILPKSYTVDFRLP